jgi:hypothetical protein
MSSKIWFYNHWGELEDGGYPVSTTPRSWVLNGYGRTDFAIGLSDSTLKERYLRVGNFVRIVHYPTEEANRIEYGILPEWVGLIIPAQQWNKDALVVSAVSIEALLAYRRVPFMKVEGTPDVVFKKIIQAAQANEEVQNGSIPLTIGQVDTATTNKMLSPNTFQAIMYSDELRTNAYDHIRKLTQTAGVDWDITHAVTPSGSLTLKANLYARKGFEGLVLAPKNSDDQNPLLTMQGTIINHIFAHNQAQTEATRIMYEAKARESIDKYGPFQSNIVLTGVTDGARLADSAQSRVYSTSEPVRMVSRTALDFEDTFSYIAPGNTCYVYDPRVGFNPDGSLGFRSWARILSADYNDMTNKCAVHVELTTRSVPFPDPEGFFH